MKIYAFLMLLTLHSHSRLLDRIVAVFDDQIISEAEVKRIEKTVGERKKIAGALFPKERYSRKDIIEKEIETKVVRSHLSTVGYVVSDDQVETMIKSLEKRNGITREQLVDSLKQEDIAFTEYFELLRSNREFNILMNAIIEPLVSITDQQIKNAFFRKNANNKTISVSYELVAYKVSASLLKKQGEQNIKAALQNYLNSGILGKGFSTIEEISLGSLKDEDLSQEVANVLKLTDEGSFSKPIDTRGSFYIYYVKNKDAVESNLFAKAKPYIRAALFEKEAGKVFSVWIEREKQKHFIKKI